ncbi:hypothetical protein [Methylovirgula sp. 4M-Z18]|uniref:hypothetical protein n=1 Tax=Methylovirgula sp. 4M-Z18 TaxID=2293567 RepID=UPI000E36B063|nr:hypothetical protein [Methylovirgula sp. 4M-Z18]RFB78427.1 hypothetical protein DYH55_16955 [Methylovirgula sp. 4M-Z18]
MKKPIAIALFTLVLASPCLAQDARYPSLIGDWQGSYYCAQGHTGLTLTITAQSGKAFSGLFHFYAAPDNADVPEGCFTVSGRFVSRHQLVIDGANWITHPKDYITVDLDGVLGDSAAGSAIAGTVLMPGKFRDVHLCTTFRVTKAPGPPNVDKACQSDTASR